MINIDGKYIHVPKKELESFDQDLSGASLDSSIDDYAFDNLYFSSSADSLDLSGDTIFHTEPVETIEDGVLLDDYCDPIRMSNVDSTLAKSIHMFLNGEIDELPPFIVMDSYMKSSGGVISFGCGITVTKDFKVKILSPSVERRTTRVDVIYNHGYYGYYEYQNEYQTKRPFDAQSNPLYDLDRIYRLVAYIVDYKEYRKKEMVDFLRETLKK